MYWKTDFQTLESYEATSHYRSTYFVTEINYALPWGLYLYTNFTLRKNAGNSNTYIYRVTSKWNASISKEILDGRLNIRLSANDILNKAGNIFTNVNTFSRTESYTNIMPRYFMLTISSNLSWAKNNE